VHWKVGLIALSLESCRLVAWNIGVEGPTYTIRLATRHLGLNLCNSETLTASHIRHTHHEITASI